MMVTNIDNLKLIADTIQRKEQDDKQHSLSMFKIGKELLATKYGLTIRQLGRALGVQYVELSMAKTIAKKFDTESQFIDFMVSIKSYKWKDVKYRCRVKTRPLSTATGEIKLMDLMKSIRSYLSYSKDLPKEENDLYITELNKVRNLINRFVPKMHIITDDNYLKYGDCCGCGEYPPPPEGYELITFTPLSYKEIHYPMCQACIDSNIKPNFEYIAKMYHSYSLNLEEAFETLIL